jgi:hypothetical protein
LGIDEKMAETLNSKEQAELDAAGEEALRIEEAIRKGVRETLRTTAFSNS